MKKFYEYVCRAEALIAEAAMAILTVLVFVSAVARCLHHPIIWAVDAATFLFAWCVFLGGDVAMRNDKLVCIDVITGKLPKKVQRYLNVINYLIIIVFLGALIGYGSVLSYTTRLRTFQGIPGFSYTWVTISVPVGSTLMLITSILKIKALFVKTPKNAEVQQGVTELI